MFQGRMTTRTRDFLAPRIHDMRAVAPLDLQQQCSGNSAPEMGRPPYTKQNIWNSFVMQLQRRIGSPSKDLLQLLVMQE